MIDILEQADEWLMAIMNGPNTPFWTEFMLLYTGKLIWAPLYIALAWLLFANFKVKDAIFAFLAIVLVIVIADQLCASVIRPIIERPRPCNPNSPIYDLVFKTRDSGGFGFPSCHGANTFGLAAIVCYIFKDIRISILFLLWAAINSYTRIYLGLHFPGDILAGALIGWGAAFVSYKLFRVVTPKNYKPYKLKLAYIPGCVFAATVIAIVILSI